MLDFSKIGQVAETLEGATRDIDSRLQSIENLLLTLIAMQAYEISLRYGETSGFPADVTGVIDQARHHANEWRKHHAKVEVRPPSADDNTYAP